MPGMTFAYFTSPQDWLIIGLFLIVLGVIPFALVIAALIKYLRKK